MVWEKLRKQMGVVTGFGLKDKAYIVVDQISDMRAVGIEFIFDHHAFINSFNMLSFYGQTLVNLFFRPQSNSENFMGIRL